MFDIGDIVEKRGKYGVIIALEKDRFAIIWVAKNGDRSVGTPTDITRLVSADHLADNG